jgi:RNA polymerase sigma-70 factor (ECF subfamily)
MLVTVCRNLARNMRRRHHRSRPHSEDGLEEVAAPSDHAEALTLAHEQDAQLSACVAGLGELQRRVVTLRLLEERAGQDVAELLGVSHNHVAVLLRRAKLALRECVQRAGVTG